jgi:hypothetical protein
VNSASDDRVDWGQQHLRDWVMTSRRIPPPEITTATEVNKLIIVTMMTKVSVVCCHTELSSKSSLFMLLCKVVVKTVRYKLKLKRLYKWSICKILR